jgi:D-xylose 1-dehydrogenase
MGRLEGAVAIVTGGASGMGASHVRGLVAEGARVVVADIAEDAGRALVEELADAARFFRLDVTDDEQWAAVVTYAEQELGPVTILVNNAADDQRHKVESLTVEEWDDRLNVNLRHHFFAAQAVAPMMRDAGRGSIVNLGSISAHIDLLDLPVYIAAKSAIEGLTRTLARELGPDGIRVNCVIPGWIMTERQLTHWITPEAEAAIERNQSVPQKLYPADVARMILWLAADDSRSCTAQMWVVDGGWM